MAKGEISWAEIRGWFVGAVAFRNVGHAAWQLVYADGSSRNQAVICGRDELLERGLAEV